MIVARATARFTPLPIISFQFVTRRLQTFNFHRTPTMKNILRIGLISVSLGAGSYAAPFMAIGDGAELFLTGTLGVRADDNIFLSQDGDSDVIFDINPGVELTFGKDAQLKGSLTLVDAIATYSDHSDLNSNLFSADFVSKYDDGKLKLGFNASYRELNQNTVDNRGLTRRDVFTTGGNTEVEVSQLTSVGGGVVFSHENYKRRGYTDSDNITVPVDFYYKWTPKLDVSVGYRYRDYEVDLGQDSKDHFFNIGARGEFSPKLTGKLAVGWTKRKFEGRDPFSGRFGGDDDMFGVDASFAYEISPKTSLQLGASNDFGTSPQGLQQQNLIFNGMVTTKITEEWTVNAGLSYRGIDYGTRTDDYWEGVLGTAYIINANVRIVGSYVYRDYKSDVRLAEFENNVFSIAANFRY
jgi:polysaccharide biosynthesis protein VpsM